LGQGRRRQLLSLKAGQPSEIATVSWLVTAFSSAVSALPPLTPPSSLTQKFESVSLNQTNCHFLASSERRFLRPNGYLRVTLKFNPPSDDHAVLKVGVTFKVD
jgi:hypothetical protein